MESSRLTFKTFRAGLAALCLVTGIGLLGASPAARAQGPRTCPADAQPLTAELFAAAKAQATDRGLLWRISKDGKASFLYGTLHVGKAGWMAPGPLLLRALQASDVLALELDPLDQNVQTDMMAAMAARPPVYLPPQLQARLRKAWDAACLSAAAQENMAVEMQAYTLGLMADRQGGFDATYGSELLLSLVMRGAGKPVVSLETAALQMQMLFGRNHAESVEIVQGALDELENGRARDLLLKTVRLWETADLAELELYPQWCECTKTALDREMLRRLLEARNPGMADGIDRLHGEGKRTFAAVGAMHMIGATGLPALLAQRGYTVERLR